MTSSPVTNNGSFQNYRLTWAITLHRLYELIIVFVYEVCPTLILAATSGGRVTVHHAGVHICVHSRHLYILVVKLFLYTVTLVPEAFLYSLLANFATRTASFNCFYWHEALRAEKRKPLVKTVGNLTFMPSAFDRRF